MADSLLKAASLRRNWWGDARVAATASEFRTSGVGLDCAPDAPLAASSRADGRMRRHRGIQGRVLLRLTPGRLGLFDLQRSDPAIAVFQASGRTSAVNMTCEARRPSIQWNSHLGLDVAASVLAGRAWQPQPCVSYAVDMSLSRLTPSKTLRGAVTSS